LLQLLENMGWSRKACLLKIFFSLFLLRPALKMLPMLLFLNTSVQKKTKNKKNIELHCSNLFLCYKVISEHFSKNCSTL